MIETERLQEIVIEALEDVKGGDIRVLNVYGKTSVTDILIIATGNTSRQVKALADSVVQKVKEHDYMPIGTEGVDQGEWALVDLGDIVVHIMQPGVRAFYNLEKLWGDDSPAVKDINAT